MKIFDPRDNKTYDIENLRTTVHQLIVDGKKEAVDCVEYTVIGTSHKWDFWMKYSDFSRANLNTAMALKNN